MGIYFNVGVIPTYHSILPTGIHNAFPDFIRKYLPVYDYTVAPFIFTPFDSGPNKLFPLGIKIFPDQIFTSKR